MKSFNDFRETQLDEANKMEEGYVPPERNRPELSSGDKDKLGKLASLMSKEKSKKKKDLPFTPDKPHAPVAKAGKYGSGYSTARHLARQGMKDVQKEETDMSQMDKYLAAISGNADFRTSLEEKTLTPAELKKREEIAQAIERENPGMDKSKKMAIATAQAKKVAEETEGMHYCAKHVYSEEFGEGFVVEGSHAEPDANGLIEWYDVDFGGNVQRVMTEKVKVMHAEYHMNHKKKMKEEEEGDTPDNEKEKSLAKLAKPYDKVTQADVLKGRGVTKEGVEMKSYSQLMADLEEAKKSDYWDFKDLDDKPAPTTRKVAGTRYGGSAQKDDKYDEDDETEVNQTQKRGRGRPAGSKSGARH